MQSLRFLVSGERRFVFLVGEKKIAFELQRESGIVSPNKRDLLGRFRIASAEKTGRGVIHDRKILARLEIHRVKLDRLFELGLDPADAHRAAHDSILRRLQPERASEPLMEF